MTLSPSPNFSQPLLHLSTSCKLTRRRSLSLMPIQRHTCLTWKPGKPFWPLTVLQHMVRLAFLQKVNSRQNQTDTFYNTILDNSPLTQINQIITHPTLPLAITGHEDKYIRFFDLNTGSCVNSMVAHLDAVSCLAINPNGLGLVSGGHDSSVRFWDINTHACTQEFPSHRKKYNEGVHSLAFHPTTPILASGGADATVRVYN